MLFQWSKQLLQYKKFGYQRLGILYNQIYRLQNLLINSLPNRCLLCHQHTYNQSNGLCHPCLNACIYQHHICLGCGKSIATLSYYCGACMPKMPLPVVAVASYHSPIGHIVAALKYQRQFSSLAILVDALIQRIENLRLEVNLPKPQIIMPVPMHSIRLKQKGFNQAYLIADEIANKLNLPIDSESLIRVQHTPAQAGLDGLERRKNLRNAFDLSNDFSWQRVALIDDVVTTGSTINEIYRLFKKRHIHLQVWCLARAENKNLT